ncbi:MAG: CBS domain-containing protein [Owenweeksia sp.]|nr:CBS domain-containing protein [Owenweeksia sp.]
MMKVTTHMLNDLKPLHLNERICDLLEAMKELKYTHLPVVDEKRHYLGLVCGDDLLDVPREDDPTLANMHAFYRPMP